MKRRKTRDSAKVPVQQSTTSKTMGRCNTDTIEDIRSATRTVIERVEGKIGALTNEMGSFRDEMNTCLELVEAGLRDNTQGMGELKKDMQRIKVDVRENRDDVKDLQCRVHRIELNMMRLYDRVEYVVGRLEKAV